LIGSEDKIAEDSFPFFAYQFVNVAYYWLRRNGDLATDDRLRSYSYNDSPQSNDIASAKAWPAGATPKAAPGLAVQAYASGLEHPRWFYTLPNGYILVAETDYPF
jgi:glucose/arabinose dehydrogenase